MSGPEHSDDAPHPSGLPGPPPSEPAARPWADPPATGGGFNAPPVPSGHDTAARGTFSPHGGGPELVLAGWWRRVGAQLIDGLILGAISLVIFFAILVPVGLAASSDSDAGTAAAVVAFLVGVLAYLVATLLYAPLMMAKTNGQTLGRMATGIRVVRTDGQAVGFGWAALREVVLKGLLINGLGALVTGGILGLLDVLWPLWDGENRALHDMMANSRVVEA